MKQSILILFALIGLTTFANAQKAKKMNEEQKLKDVVMAYEKGLTDGNATALVNLYTKDATFIPNQQPTMTGSQNFTGFYQYFFNNYKVAAKIDIDKVIVNGNDGTVLSHSQETMTGKDGSTFSIKAREVFLLKKVNGEWKINIYMYNEPAKDK